MPFRIWASRQRLPPSTARRAWLVYDGACPLCHSYARYLDVQESIGELVLVNVREGGPLVQELRDLGHDLNTGMALKLNGRYYLGSDALHLLALLSRKRGLFSLGNRVLFRSPVVARLGYPLLLWGRRCLLKLRGTAAIR